MTLRVCGTSLLFCLLTAQLGAAQVRQISGRVTNSSTQQGLPEATVAVRGTGIVAGTSNEGNYVLNAPDGDQTLVVRAPPPDLIFLTLPIPTAETQPRS